MCFFLCFALGISWQDKIQKIREKMQTKKCGALVISALDEIACMYSRLMRLTKSENVQKLFQTKYCGFYTIFIAC